jgi:uncharacterized phage infection (PIP) family protein YhgE
VISPWFRANIQLDRIEQELKNLSKGQTKIMAALDDVKAGEAAIDKGISDIAAYLKTLAGNLAGGISATDAETIATELNAKAAALEALVPPAPTA